VPEVVKLPDEFFMTITFREKQVHKQRHFCNSLFNVVCTWCECTTL